MASNVTIFAGLGTPAGVLIESVKWIRQSNVAATAYVVGPGEPERSRFLQELGLPRDSYIQMSWNEFMAALDRRVAEEQRARLHRACEELKRENGWDAEDVIGICARIARLGVLDMGRLRSDWILQKTSYLPLRGLDTHLWADLVLAIALIERTTGSESYFLSDSMIEFRVGTRIAGLIIVASGRGTRRWHALETDIQRGQTGRTRRASSPGFAVIAGALPPPNETAPPADPLQKTKKAI